MMPTFHVQSAWPWLLPLASCQCTHREAAVMAQVLGSLPATRETLMEFPVPGFSSRPAPAVAGVWEVKQQVEDPSLSQK